MTDQTPVPATTGGNVPTVTTERDLILSKLKNPRQVKFCKLYAQNIMLFGNGAQCYGLAYNFELEKKSKVNQKDENGKEIPGTSEYDRACVVCAVGALRLLRRDYIQNAVIFLQNEMVDERVVDARLGEIILTGRHQDAVAAIREFNRVKGRVIEKRETKHAFLGVLEHVYKRADEIEKQNRDDRQE